MLPTGFRTFHFVSFLYVFFFSFLFFFFCFFSFLTILFSFFYAFRFFRFFSLLFSVFSFCFFFSFRFFSFLFVFFRFSVYRCPKFTDFLCEHSFKKSLIKQLTLHQGWINTISNTDDKDIIKHKINKGCIFDKKKTVFKQFKLRHSELIVFSRNWR